MKLELQSNLEGGLNDVNEVLEKQKSGFAYFVRALIYREMGEIKKAVSDIEEASKLTPTDRRFYVNRLLIRISAKLEDALHTFEKLLKSGDGEDELTAKIYFERANYYVEKKENFEQALSDFNHAIAILDSQKFKDQKFLYAKVYANKIDCLIKLRRFEDALREANFAIGELDDNSLL